MAIGGPPGGHEVGGRAHGVGRTPTLVGRVWPPGELLALSIFYIYSEIDFREVSGLLELCRIGLQYLLLFQPRIPAAGILPLHVNLVK